MTFFHVLATWLVHEIAEWPLDLLAVWVLAVWAFALAILAVCRGGHPRSRREF